MKCWKIYGCRTGTDPTAIFTRGSFNWQARLSILQKNRLRPSAALLKLAQTNLEKYPAQHEQLNLAAVQLLIAGWQAQLERSGFHQNPLTANNLPQLALQPA